MFRKNSLTFAAAAIALTSALSAAPVFAAATGQIGLFPQDQTVVARKGADDRIKEIRGGRGKDDARPHRSKPRIRGGSGCNSIRDLIEHPECRG